MGTRIDETRMVAKRTAVGKCENGCSNGGGETKNKLDTCTPQNCYQLLQIPWKGGFTTSIFRRGREGECNCHS
jgi:hypothetical protein